MARTKGALGKGARQAPRSAYDTYSYWYDRYTKGTKSNWFEPKLNREEFAEAHQNAKDAGLTNPARSVAMAQEYVDRSFERAYKKVTGHAMGDISTSESREQIFRDYAKAEGIDLDEADKLGGTAKKRAYKQAKRKFNDAFY